MIWRGLLRFIVVVAGMFVEVVRSGVSGWWTLELNSSFGYCFCLELSGRKE